MEIALYTPDLTSEEAERFWMTPVEVCDLAAIGEASDPKVKKLLNTLSDRGHVPFKKSGEARTAPRLYSLVSAAMLRTIYEVIQDGRTYRYAQPVADAVRKTLIKCIDELADIHELDAKIGSARLVFAGMKDDGTPQVLKWTKGKADGGPYLSYSVFDGGYAIYRVTELYADAWARELKKRGANE